MEIPITFEYQGKEYKGSFSPVNGMAATVWHLMIDNYYYGQLMHTEKGFVFHGNTMEDMAEFFGNHIMIAYESL